jgi:hypothetical protein
MALWCAGTAPTAQQAFARRRLGSPTHIAGYVLRLRVDAVVVMCGHVRCQRKAGRGGAVRSVNRVTVAKLTVGRGCAPPTVTQRTSLTPSSMLVWCVWRFYALQLVDEFSDASGGVLVECAGSDRREDA